jgi:septum formation protein
LLQQLGVKYELLLPRPDEDAEALEAERPGEGADAYVLRVCAAKAHAAYARRVKGGHVSSPILVADTTVTLDGAIMGKPDNAEHAVAMLERLSGRDHEVLTALAVVNAEGELLEPVLSRSLVRVAVLERAALQRYAATGEPLGKAGAYGVQGRAAAFIERIEGSYSGIMGLPLFETAALLRVARVDF